MYKLTNAAGTAKTAEAAHAILGTRSRSVMLGSFAPDERSGNDGTVDYFGEAFSLNVRGIPSPSVEVWTALVTDVTRWAKEVGKRVGVSVAAFEPKEYGELARRAFGAGADFVELNFGCPNMQEGGTFAPIMSFRPAMVADAIRSLPDGEMWAKVSPIFDDALFADLAAVLRPQTRHRPVLAGVVAVNTLPQCLALDDDGKPLLSFGSGVGGMAGPALKPIALAQVAKWARLGFKVVGAGGITSGLDLRDFLAVGAESCQANTVLQREGPSALDRIQREFDAINPVLR